MVKKIATIAAAGAMLASVALPVLAQGGRPMPMRGDSNVAIVNNGASAGASTGYISLMGNGATVGGAKGDVSVGGNNKVITGHATANANALTVANVSIGCCEEPGPSCDRPCGRRGGGRGQQEGSTNNFAMVNNGASAGASTGWVSLYGNNAVVVDGEDGDSCQLRGRCHGGRHGRDKGGDVSVSGQNSVLTGNAWSLANAWTLVNLDWDK